MPRWRASSSSRWWSRPRRGSPSGTKVPFHFIANDGNFVVKPLRLTELDEQGVGERYDIVVDFSQFRPGDSVYLVNLLQQTDGRKPDGAVSVGAGAGRRQRRSGGRSDPGVQGGADAPQRRRSEHRLRLFRHQRRPERRPVDQQTGGRRARRCSPTQIPIVAPVRERVIEWGRGGGDARDNPGGQCIPECGDITILPVDRQGQRPGVRTRSTPTASAR